MEKGSVKVEMRVCGDKRVEHHNRYLHVGDVGFKAQVEMKKLRGIHRSEAYGAAASIDGVDAVVEG